jgi:tRNA(Met) cytidine acetyltransferase
VAAIEHVARGHRHRPLVLRSDRGRGKSSAMGIAAANLMREAPRRLLVSAPRRSAADALFRQAAQLLPDGRWHAGELHFASSRLGYSAPDHLLAEPATADLLLVDEAAAIPSALLEGLLANYPRVVFATTVHGYEGTGRGFDLRFKAHLDRQTPHWLEQRLQTPIRWAADDPLEPLLFRMLGLDAEPAADRDAAQATPQTVTFERPEPAWLMQNEAALQQLFGLLVQAHYRTTPIDFRLLLDAPNLQCLLLRHHSAVVGVALLCREGEFNPGMAREIWAGRRRPKGHLLAQSLAAHVGILSAPELKALRIQRIAIHPAARRRGLGSLLLKRIRDEARLAGYDYLGTSFGASETLFDFWHGNGFRPVRLGLRAGTRSGDRSLLMLAPLSDAGERLSAQAGERFAHQLPALLGDPLRDLPAALATRLLAATGSADGSAPEPDDWSDLAGFAFARRGYECCLPAIEKLALLGLGSAELSPSERELLVLRVVQKRPWRECARLSGLGGRKQTLTRLREILAGLYDRFADDAARDLADSVKETPTD